MYITVCTRIKDKLRWKRGKLNYNPSGFDNPSLWVACDTYTYNVEGTLVSHVITSRGGVERTHGMEVMSLMLPLAMVQVCGRAVAFTRTI